MDFTEVLRVFGGAIYGDAPSLDFDRADTMIRSLEASSLCPETRASVDEKAGALLLRALHHALAGDIASASAGLDTLLALPRLARRWQLRAAMYRFYVLVLRHRPSALKFFFVGRDPIAMATTEKIMTESSTAKQISQEIFTVQPPNVIDCWEAGSILDAWEFSYSLHLSFAADPTFLGATPADRAAAAASDLQLASELFADEFSRRGLPRMAPCHRRFRLEVGMTRSDPGTAAAQREAVRAAYARCGDQAMGDALCRLLEADAALAPPFTSPLALNLICQVSEGWDNDVWDDSEPHFTLRYNAAAETAYLDAVRLFAAAGSPRAGAEALLRLGCMHHGEALWLQRVGNGPAMHQHYGLAASNMDRALELIGRHDAILRPLATCHRLLLDVNSSSRDASGHADALLPRARTLGEQLRCTGSDRVAAFIGTLMLRFARLLAVHCGAAAKAETAVCCAAEFYDGLCLDPLGRLAAGCARMSLMKSRSGGAGTWAARALVQSLAYGRGDGNGGATPLAQAVVSIDRLLAESEPAQHLSLTLRRTKTIQAFRKAAHGILPVDEAAQLNELLGRLETVDDVAGLWRAISNAPHIVESIQSTPGAGPAVQNIKYFHYEIATGRDVASRYAQIVGKFHRIAGAGHLKQAKADLQSFADDITAGSSGTAALFRILSLSQLDRYDEAQVLLGKCLSPHFLSDPTNESVSTAEQGSPYHLAQSACDLGQSAMGRAAYEDIHACVLAQAWQRGSQLLSGVECVLPGFLETKLQNKSPGDWLFKSCVGAIHEHNGYLDEAMRWYLAAFEQLEQIREATPDLDARLEVFDSAHIPELYCGLTRLCMNLSLVCDYNPASKGLATKNWLNQALLFLEQGRARTLLDVLRARETAGDKELDEMMKTVYRRRLISCLFAPSAEHAGQGLHRLAGNEIAQRLGIDLRSDSGLDRVEVALREMEARFPAKALVRGAAMLPQLTDDEEGGSLFGWIPRDALVIEVDASMHSLVSLCISRHGGVEAMHMSTELTCWRLRDLVLGYLETMDACRQHLEKEESTHFAAKRASLLDAARAISAHVVEPYAPLIRRPWVCSVIVVPGSYLRLFPPAALLLDSQPLILTCAVYQAPSLGVLAHLARRDAAVATMTTTRGSPDAQSSSPAAAVAVVAPGATSGKSGDPDYAWPEVAAVCDTMGTRPWEQGSGGGCSDDDLTTLFSRAKIVHLAAHGVEISASPWESYVQLGAKRRYRVVDLARVRGGGCRTGLVVFGACESGRGAGADGAGTGGGDAAVGFTHAVLQSGSLCFLGALWRVNDRASMLLMHLFYRTLRDRATTPVRSTVAECWQSTVRRFCALDGPGAAAVVAEIEEVWRTAAARGIRPEDDSNHAGTNLFFAYDNFMNGDQELHDLSHPYYWAGFSLVGYGAWSLRM